MTRMNERGAQLRQARLKPHWVLACAALVVALVGAAMLSGAAYSNAANAAGRFGRAGGFGAGFGGQNGGFGGRGQGQRPGPGTSGFGQNGGFGGNTGAGTPNLLDAVAAALGISSDALQAELTAGTSISQVISEHGTTPDAIVAAAVAQEQAQLDQQVAAGQLNQQQADATLANLRTSLTQAIADNTLNGNGGFSGFGSNQPRQRPATQNGQDGQP